MKLAFPGWGSNGQQVPYSFGVLRVPGPEVLRVIGIEPILLLKIEYRPLACETILFENQTCLDDTDASRSPRDKRAMQLDFVHRAFAR
jgi:hypothetical protein